MTSPKKIRITKIEDRPKDAWIDLGLRQLREGEVRFYRAKDPLTGEWLFKVCPDWELGRVTVKALKCPPGKTFAQLEGSSMLFQRSTKEDLLYDTISVAYVNQDGRLRRNLVQSLDEIPTPIRESFEIKPYQEATGKKAPGKNWVTLTKEGDEKAMITLFLLERAWPVSPVPLEGGLNTVKLLAVIKELERVKVEDLYRVAEQQLGISKGEVESLLAYLEKGGKVERPEAGYVKSAG